MRHKGTALCMLLFLAGFVAACSLWLQAQRRQYALNRRLIDALLNHDNRQALALVNAGADPNTLFYPPPTPSLEHVWDQLLRRNTLPVENNPTAMQLVCGTPLDDEERYWYVSPADDPQLLDAMLRHGADVNRANDYNEIPLMSVMHYGPGTAPPMVGMLLQQGAYVNAQNDAGWTPLHYAVEDGTDRETLRLLLAHGANPNLRDKDGNTPLMLAQEKNRTNLVALLQQATAKETGKRP